MPFGGAAYIAYVITQSCIFAIRHCEISHSKTCTAMQFFFLFFLCVLVATVIIIRRLRNNFFSAERSLQTFVALHIVKLVGIVATIVMM